jgi:hypothetical protein
MRENFTHYATAQKSTSGFHWHFCKKTDGISIAQQVFRTGVDGAYDLNSSTNRHPTNEKPKNY